MFLHGSELGRASYFFIFKLYIPFKNTLVARAKSRYKQKYIKNLKYQILIKYSAALDFLLHFLEYFILLDCSLYLAKVRK